MKIKSISILCIITLLIFAAGFTYSHAEEISEIDEIILPEELTTFIEIFDELSYEAIYDKEIKTEINYKFEGTETLEEEETSRISITMISDETIEASLWINDEDEIILTKIDDEEIPSFMEEQFVKPLLAGIFSPFELLEKFQLEEILSEEIEGVSTEVLETREETYNDDLTAEVNKIKITVPEYEGEETTTTVEIAEFEDFNMVVSYSFEDEDIEFKLKDIVLR